MQLKKVLKLIFKITPFKLLFFLVLVTSLSTFKIICLPFMTFSGALLSDGQVGGGLRLPCGSFSRWLWENPTAYRMFLDFNTWYVILFSLLIIFISSFVILIIKYKLNLPLEHKHNKYLTILAYLIIIIISFFVFIRTFVSF